MYIESINLKNFRNIGNLSINGFSPGVNILYGSNGSGKTNILEALGLSSIAKSCRGASDRDMVKFGEASTQVAIEGFTQKKK